MCDMKHQKDFARLDKKLDLLSQKMELGFNGVNSRLDTANSKLATHEKDIRKLQEDDLKEHARKMDNRTMLIIGIVIGAIIIAAGLNLRQFVMNLL